MFLFWHQLLFCFVPRPLEGQPAQTAPYTGDIEFIVVLNCGTVLCVIFAFCSGQAWEAGVPWTDGPRWTQGQT